LKEKKRVLTLIVIARTKDEAISPYNKDEIASGAEKAPSQ
jgi:hypothetical protein